MGAVIGLKRSVNVVGILGEAALRRVMGGRGYHATAEWGASIDIGIFYDAHQRAYLAPEAGGACIHAWGAMVDAGLTGMSIRIDKKKNELNYGHGITADDILLGNVAPPSEFSKLFDSIGQVSNAANMAAFIDRSTASTTQITMSRSQKPQ